LLHPQSGIRNDEEQKKRHKTAETVHKPFYFSLSTL
jgi:hypothetical protein